MCGLQLKNKVQGTITLFTHKCDTELPGVNDLLGSSSAETNLAVPMGTKLPMILQRMPLWPLKACDNFKLSSEIWLFGGFRTKDYSGLFSPSLRDSLTCLHLV